MLTSTCPSNLCTHKVPSNISMKVFAIALILSACSFSILMLTNTFAEDANTASISKLGIAVKNSLVNDSPYKPANSSKNILGVSPFANSKYARTS